MGEIKEQEINQMCFACGIHNPIGLKLKFREEQDTYITTFTGGPEHQGYDGIMHGGIVSTLLDEVMARYIYSKGYNAVTARLDVRYKKPTPIGEQLMIKGHITGQRGNMFELTGTIELPDGSITAQGKATVAILEG
ncbi:PaaI family thioesterase [Dendrosporobacter sp. 1207_IL3150]|uniref:PaaI family thioesterase n=1 Tax=Dendrosporobacter sp. 1207_IL3150 TaxID=3084054 RepID=UPI002FD8F046